jgi:hypothetical protein
MADTRRVLQWERVRRQAGYHMRALHIALRWTPRVTAYATRHTVGSRAAAERHHETCIAEKPSRRSTAVGLAWDLQGMRWPTLCPHFRQDMRHGECALRRAMAVQRQSARPAATRHQFARTVRTPSDGTLQCCSDAW